MMNYIETVTGKKFYFDDIESNEIDIYDISWSLSGTNRYNYHTLEPWTVGQHSMLVADLVDHNNLLMKYAMLHDASEAYLGDLVGPLKNFCPDFKAIEHAVETHIYLSFGLYPKLPRMVKHADLVALGVEKRRFMLTNEPWECLEGVVLPHTNLEVTSPAQTHNNFLAKWESLQQ